MSEPVKKLIPQLNLAGLIVFGLSYMAPAVVIATFGVIATISQGATPMAYVFATLAMLLTAVSYGKLARRFPASGSVYTYARRTIGSKLGFLAGWIILLDYLFLPMVAWLIIGLFFSAQFPFLPPWAWGLIVIAFCTAMNILGMKVADRFNRFLLIFVMIGILCLIGFGIAFAGGSGVSPTVAIWPESTTFSLVAAGAAVAAYSFLGFDAVSTLSEEVKNPRTTVPRGIVAVVISGGIIFVASAFVMQWAHPSLEFANADTAGFEILNVIGGPVFAGLVNSTVLIGGLASCVAVQASGSRLLFVMGRDGVFPKKAFGHLSEKFRTPTFNLLFIATIGLAGQFLSMGDATSLINFGAFLAFTIANICVFVLWWKNRSSMPLRTHFFGYLLIPALGVAVDLYLLFHLSTLALIIGSIWLTAGVIYLAFLTRGFSRPAPGLDIDTVESDDTLTTTVVVSDSAPAEAATPTVGDTQGR
ncbi:APC family permease [Leucobacter sp. cx-42]|uniref:APC family permease n=1 Tax=unclassified Leucobacter TaxID=2621730 RepID=UPI00165E8E7E|nr:APC family permease [Leucobacter sp. cx-42]